MTKLIRAISSASALHKDNPNNLVNIRKELVARQNGKCPITKRDLRVGTSSNVVVDHDHSTGIIRAALPRAINGLEGKLVQACIRWGGCKSKIDVIKMLRGIADYLEHHMVARTEWIHPSHLTPFEKREKSNKVARKRYAAKKNGD